MDVTKKLVMIPNWKLSNRKVATRKPNRARFPRYDRHINELMRAE